MSAFSPELRLSLALLRSALGPPAAARPVAADAAVNWRTFLGTVERHRIGAFLHHRLAADLPAQCPPGIVRELRDQALANHRRALTQAAEVIRLLRLLGPAGIVALPVKGLVLAQQLYGTIGIRHVGDIDLLVTPEEAARADALLRADGLRRTRPDFSLTPRQMAEFVRVKPEFEYVREPKVQRIELLWRLEGLPVTAADWAQAAPGNLAGHPVRALAPDLNLIYLFEHGARHGWFRLFWLVDVALLLRDERIDWIPVVARARALGLERSLLQGAALAHTLLGSPLPPALLPLPGERRPVAALVTEACRQLARPPAADEPVGEWLRQTLYRTRLRRHLRAKFAVLTPHLFSPLNWQTLPLPDRWFFVYSFVTPCLWIWRRLRRRA